MHLGLLLDLAGSLRLNLGFAISWIFFTSRVNKKDQKNPIEFFPKKFWKNPVNSWEFLLCEIQGANTSCTVWRAMVQLPINGSEINNDVISNLISLFMVLPFIANEAKYHPVVLSQKWWSVKFVFCCCVWVFSCCCYVFSQSSYFSVFAPLSRCI